MDPTSDKPHREHRSRYTSQQQALPNSSRRIARSQRTGTHRRHDEDIHGERAVPRYTDDRERRRNKDKDKERPYRDRATEDLIDHLKESHRSSKTKSRSVKKLEGEEREGDGRKKKEKEKRLKEIQDLIQDVKQGSRDRRRDGGKGISGSRDGRKRDDERLIEQEGLCDSLPPAKFDDIDGHDELSDGELNNNIDVKHLKDVPDFVEDEFEDSDGDFSEEQIDQSDYNHTTIEIIDEGGQEVVSEAYGFNNSDFGNSVDYAQNSEEEDFIHPDLESEYEATVISKSTENPRSNSPELNPIYKLDKIRGPNFYEQAIVTRQISSDPPTAAGEEEMDFHGSMDPTEEIGSVYQRELELDAPPSPRSDCDLERNNKNSSRSRDTYTNYVLDDIGREQYNQMIVPIEEVRKMKVQQDPPECNRGLEVPAPRGPRVRSSYKRESVEKKKRQEEEKKKPQIKSILKKKGSPPISYFGKPVQFEDEVSSGSEPEVTEVKQGRRKEVDDKSVVSKTGLRSGKYANLNEAARQDQDSGDDDDASKDDSISIEQKSDEESDSGTLNTLTGSSDDRFNRSKTYYLRTSDLGLTQDTIFAEQFLDNPKAKAEPHYHHPSPHPPPGIQFHVDENFLAVNDGIGGYSPVAPQAVDALVAIGFRTASDPVMWTPSTKTRKFMTERGLRFGDVPLPGPLDEGEGGPNDTNCMVWSGKFSHKYYGHDLLAVRSQGVINMSAEDLVDLLMDSNRIQEYNKSSNGRTDEIILSDGTNLDNCPFSGRRKKKLTGVVMDNTRIVDGVAILDSQSEDEKSDATEGLDDRSFSSTQSRKKQSSFVGVTKVVRSVNSLPLVKKKMEFVTLLHCRALTDDQGGNGYIIVGRNVYPAEDAEKSGKGVIRSEVLLNVHIIRKFKPPKKGVSSRKSKSDSKSVVSSVSGKAANARELANRCLMTNVSHLKSPMVPSLMAKKMGLSAAASFISDIRSLTEW